MRVPAPLTGVNYMFGVSFLLIDNMGRYVKSYDFRGGEIGV